MFWFMRTAYFAGRYSNVQKNLIYHELEDVKKAVTLLQASINKFKPYKMGKLYSADELEYYDSLAFRFEKSVEITLNFFKAIEMFAFAKTSDTLRDRLLVIQKLRLIDNVDFWMEARILRNKIAHTYVSEKLNELYDEVRMKSKIIFKTLKKIQTYLEKAAIRRHA